MIRPSNSARIKPQKDPEGPAYRINLAYLAIVTQQLTTNQDFLIMDEQPEFCGESHILNLTSSENKSKTAKSFNVLNIAYVIIGVIIFKIKGYFG